MKPGEDASTMMSSEGSGKISIFPGETGSTLLCEVDPGLVGEVGVGDDEVTDGADVDGGEVGTDEVEPEDGLVGSVLAGDKGDDGVIDGLDVGANDDEDSLNASFMAIGLTLPTCTFSCEFIDEDGIVAVAELNMSLVVVAFVRKLSIDVLTVTFVVEAVVDTVAVECMTVVVIVASVVLINDISVERPGVAEVAT